MNINLNKWFTLRRAAERGDTASQFTGNPERSGSVRTGLLIITMMFFAGLALDIGSLAVALVAFVLAERAIYPLFREPSAGRAA